MQFKPAIAGRSIIDLGFRDPGFKLDAGRWRGQQVNRIPQVGEFRVKVSPDHRPHMGIAIQHRKQCVAITDGHGVQPGRMVYEIMVQADYRVQVRMRGQHGIQQRQFAPTPDIPRERAYIKIGMATSTKVNIPVKA